MLDPADITVRSWSESDLGFVYETWSRGLRRCDPWSHIPAAIYVDAQRAHMDRALGRAALLVLTPKDESDMLWGWVCGEYVGGQLVVHWIYVKGLVRTHGIASALLGALGWKRGDTVVATQWSRACKWIAGKTPVVYDPYLMGR